MLGRPSSMRRGASPACRSQSRTCGLCKQVARPTARGAPETPSVHQPRKPTPKELVFLGWCTLDTNATFIKSTRSTNDKGSPPLNRSARHCSVQGYPSRPVSRTRRVHLKAEVPLPQPTNALCSNLHGKNHPSRRIFQGKETHPCVPVAQLVGLAACSKLSLPSTSTIDTRFLKLLQNSSRCFVNAIHSCGE